MYKARTDYLKKILYLLVIFSPLNSWGQGILNQYLQEGLEQNLVLREKNIELEKSLLALKDAKSYFLPTVDFGANYTLASGGRTISIPIGDLLNPVYSTLNQLTGSNSFPQLENVNEQFLPDNFYDARVRASLPLINTDLIYQKEIREKQVILSEYELDIYEANLIQDIKMAYYTFCTAHTAIEVIENAKVLVEQNLRDNRILLENGKGLPSSVLRAESEVENINALLIEAKAKRQNAANYVNFLLNRPIQTEVVFEPQTLDMKEFAELMGENNISGRSELLQVQTAESIQETILKSNKNYWVPKLNTFADMGSQSFDWAFDKQSRYLLFGLNMTVPLYQGNRNRNQIHRGELNLKSVQNQKELLNEKLSLDLQLAKNEVLTQQAALQSAEKKLESSVSYFRLVDRGFKEGANSLIEFLDARNQYTQASLQKTISSYNLLKSLAALERQLTTSN
ncbi:outer membrane protein TolC [Algoriphagus boseongensis]|uniref:Outer membrane protein TolC n=1 Tax=Algoriphagus boseongensis TaxID=1442587 RepID=A0A4R6T7Y0_9BACT|nr:TolC family protein [Algoriphagus boseongensis]TDQ19140.1 outer membrane protein TolC [Algoriphagus boseongensis]